MLKRLENASNLLEISKISKSLKNLFSNNMVFHETLMDLINNIIETLLNPILLSSSKPILEQTDLPLNSAKIFELFMVLSKKIDENSAVLLGKFLTDQG